MKSFIFDVLRDLLPVFSGFLGVLGVMNVFKKINGRLTLWGWLAIILIFLSTIGGVILAKKEKSDDDLEKKALQDKLNNILNDLAKVRQPLGDMSLNYWSILPNSNSDVVSYKESLKKNIASLAKNRDFKRTLMKNKNISALAIGIDGKPIIYEVSEKSSFWPNNDFLSLRDISIFYKVDMCISASKIKPEQFEPEVKPRGSADFCTRSIFPQENIIFYDVQKDEIGFITRMKFKKQDIRSNGKITSVQDLLNAWIFFQPPTRYLALTKAHIKKTDATKTAIENHDKVSAILNGIRIQSISIDSGSGQRFYIEEKDLRKFTNRSENTFFYLTMPLDSKNDVNFLSEK